MNILIIGKAKTGTTVISKTIENSISNTAFHMEPKDIYYLMDNMKSKKNNVVKIIFEHWNSTPRLRNAMIHNELKVKFDKVVFIVRDPRDEIISRMMYYIKPYFAREGFNKEKYDQWMEVVKSKEQSPDKVGIKDMVVKMNKIFGIQFWGSLRLSKMYAKFIQLHQKQNPDFFIIKYEDFIDKNVGDLEQYLGYPLNFKINEKDKVIKRTKRTAAYNNWKSFFLKKDVDFLKVKLKRDLHILGYKDWRLSKDKSIDPAELSGYVETMMKN